MGLSRRHFFQGAAGIGALTLAQAAANAKNSDQPAASANVGGEDLTIINIDLLEEQAQKKLTAFAYAFVSGAAGDEWTMRENRRAFQDFPIMTSRLTGIKKESIDTRTALMGMVLPSPIMVAPMGVHGVVSEQAELATSAGAGAAGVLYQSSGASTKPLEQIAETTNGPKWFQLYFNNDIGVTRSLLQRAAAAKYSAIVLTVDALGPGGSDRVRRLGTSVPRPKFVFGNHDPRFGGSGDFRNQKENLTWDDIAFCQEASGLPVVVKGILRAEDAVQAVKAGAAAVQVSNHGGRQMDGVPSSISVLPGVADALGGKVPIIVDGGVRRGIDVFRALALGADAVAIGRPVLYGLGVGGARGVRSVLDFFNTELKTAMLLAGVEKVDAIGRGNIVMRQFV